MKGHGQRNTTKITFVNKTNNETSEVLEEGVPDLILFFRRSLFVVEVIRRGGEGWESEETPKQSSGRTDVVRGIVSKIYINPYTIPSKIYNEIIKG